VTELGVGPEAPFSFHLESPTLDAPLDAPLVRPRRAVLSRLRQRDRSVSDKALYHSQSRWPAQSGQRELPTSRQLPGDQPDTMWPPVGIIACPTGPAARLEQKVQKSTDSKPSNH